MDNDRFLKGKKNKRTKNKKLILKNEKINKKILNKINKTKKKKTFFIIMIIIILLISFSLFFLLKFRVNKIKRNIFDGNIKYSKYEEEFRNKNSTCDGLDPINIFKLRIDKGPIEICSEGKSKHVCYQNAGNNYYNEIFNHKNGVICKMENVILDPSKSRQSGLSYKDGPVDSSNHGLPLLDKGFINADCKAKQGLSNYNELYNTYFNSWNYEYNINNENLDELAPGKTVLFISRNQDSPNLFYGNSDIINALSMIYFFNLDPNDVQVVFLESMEIPYYAEENSENKDLPRDPFYDIYKKMISRGGEPIYIKNLKKKYKISKAIHVPINWDSPLSIEIDFPTCDHRTKTYKLYNDFIDKYMDIKPFKDTFISDNETYYYPESVLKSHESNIKFDKIVTIQWRRIWPKNRKGQGRIMNNGPQLADKLASLLPKNILVRLVNNAKFTIEGQISLVRNTDYLLGLHGAGLSLVMFLPQNSIYQEMQNRKVKSQLCVVSSLSGHKTYVDEIKNSANNVDGNEMIDFDEEEVAKKVLEHMKENNFI